MADLLIITTLQGELKSLLKMIPNHSGPQIDEKTELVFYNAQLGSNIDPTSLETIIIHSSKYGRVQATLATSHAIEKWQPQYVILVGIGGGVSNQVALGDILIASTVVDYSDRIENEQDIFFRPISYSVSKKMLNVAQTLDDHSWISHIKTKRPTPGTPKIHFGPIASSDSVVSSSDFIEKLRKNIPKLLGVEMEAGGVIAALETTNHKIDFFMVRAVSDLCDNSKNDNWENYACEVSAAFAVSFIRTYISIIQKSLDQDGSIEIKHDDSKEVHNEITLDKRVSGSINNILESDSNIASDESFSQQPSKKINKDDVDGTDESISYDGEFEIGSGTNFSRCFSSKKACLRVRDYAKAIAGVLSDARGEVCFSILGHWGRGKTYLMRLTELELPDSYDTIWFSAWKYRTKPELWAHLYESFRKKANQAPLRQIIPRLFRGNLVRFGVWPVFLTIWSLSIALIPFWSLLPIILSVLGIVGAIKAITFFFKSRKKFSKIGKYFSASDHGDQLGLQAVIGDDLKTFLIGWFGDIQWSEKKRFIAIGIYFLSVIFFLFSLHIGLNKESGLEWPLLGNIQMYPSPAGLYLLIGFLLFVAIIIPPWLFKCGRNKKRALLIVDDLDRMPPEEMLEVAESIKLFLEDEEISRLIQVVMIFEEESLRNALLNKYGKPLKAKTNLHIEDSRAKAESAVRRVIEENIQKLFIAHLRLPPLQLEEQLEFLSSTIDYTSDPSTKEDTSKENRLQYQDSNSVAHVEHPDAKNSADNIINEQNRLTSAQHKASVVNKAIEIELSNIEKIALANALKRLSSNEGDWASLGPRSILSFVFRYKLARLLLLARDCEINPELIATSIADRLSGQPFNEDELMIPQVKSVHAIVATVA